MKGQTSLSTWIAQPVKNLKFCLMLLTAARVKVVSMKLSKMQIWQSQSSLMPIMMSLKLFKRILCTKDLLPMLARVNFSRTNLVCSKLRWDQIIKLDLLVSLEVACQIPCFRKRKENLARKWAYQCFLKQNWIKNQLMLKGIKIMDRVLAWEIIGILHLCAISLESWVMLGMIESPLPWALAQEDLLDLYLLLVKVVSSLHKSLLGLISSFNRRHSREGSWKSKKIKLKTLEGT